MTYKYYTNLDKYRRGLKNVEARDKRLAQPQSGSVQMGSQQMKPSDWIRLASVAAPMAGGALGAAVGGAGGLAAGLASGGFTPAGLAAGIPLAGAGAVGGLGVGSSLGGAAGAMGSAYADQMEADQDEEEAKYAGRDALIMSLLA